MGVGVGVGVHALTRHFQQSCALARWLELQWAEAAASADSPLAVGGSRSYTAARAENSPRLLPLPPLLLLLLLLRNGGGSGSGSGAGGAC